MVTIDPSTYTKIAEKARFVDREYGEWWTVVASVINSKSGHPLRKMATIKKKLKMSPQALVDRIVALRGDEITIDTSTYVHMNVNARFIDKEYGEWWARPGNVINYGNCHPKRGEISRIKSLRDSGKSEKTKEKRKATMLKLYGVEHCMQNKDIALRSAKSSDNISIRFHWKTGEELVCKASYELKTVEHLNKNKVDFLWQSKVFELPNGQTYRPDLFLVERSTWVEIKGYMRPKAQIKWDLFLMSFPNAEIWDCKKLKEMGIL
jgi:hypothetical protein